MVNKSVYKSAYSLAEVLVVLAMIGIIVVLSLVLIKPDNKVLKLQYYKAFNVLSVAAYNIYDKTIDEGIPMYTDKDLCEQLVYYMNNSENNNCSGAFVSLDGKNFKPENIQFKASNGMIFYMSKAFTLNDFGTAHKHRVVWVDLNGDRNPNTAVWSETRPSDIVAFDITDMGDVVPLGYPKIDNRFLMAKLVFSDENNRAVADTFYKVQKLAYGDDQYEYDAMSYNFDQKNNLFANSVLKIDNKYAAPQSAQQDPECVNDGTEDFPKCSLDVLK